MNPPGDALDIVPLNGIFLEEDGDGVEEGASEEGF